MEIKSKPVLTGVSFPTSMVESGHKRGLLCLKCGKYAKGLCCEFCQQFKKCKLCGIVCRPMDTYKVYFYEAVKGNREMSLEFSKEVVPFCKELRDGFCETCVFWESRMKHRCFLCKQDFDNTYKNYRENGNCCTNCAAKVRMNLVLRSTPFAPSYQLENA